MDADLHPFDALLTHLSVSIRVRRWFERIESAGSAGRVWVPGAVNLVSSTAYFRRGKGDIWHGPGPEPWDWSQAVAFERESQRHPFPCSYDTDTCCIMLCFSWTSSLRTRRGQRVEGRDHGTRLSVFRRFLWLKHQSFGPIPAKLPAFTITPNLNQSSQSGFAKQPLLHVPRYIQPGTAGWRHKDRDKPRPGTERKGFLPCDHPGASGVFGLPEPTSSSRV